MQKTELCYICKQPATTRMLIHMRGTYDEHKSLCDKHFRLIEYGEE